MAASDMIAVTDGERTIEVTERAFVNVYQPQGFTRVTDTPAVQEPTVAEMKAALTEAGIDFPASAKKPEIAALFATIVTDTPAVQE